MKVGIRDAKNRLSKLVDAVLDREGVFLTNRGEGVAQPVPATRPASAARGRGIWKDKVNLYPGWDSREEDDKIGRRFEGLKPNAV